MITTFSVVSGGSGGNLMKNIIIILGVANVLSDGFSMGVSRFISSETEIAQGLLKNKNAYTSGIVTFLSFVIFGLIPLIPFFIMKTPSAKYVSLLVATLLFFFIGGLKGYMLNENILMSGVETTGIGLTAAGISFIVGKQISKILSDKN